MLKSHGVLGCALIVVMAIAGNARAATIVGTDFNVTYDPTTLGLFGTLTLVGDNLFFTPNNFKAESLNGAGVVSTNSTATGIVLTANNGFHFGTLSLAEFGDYKLQGAASTVSVTGQLRAFDHNNPFFTQTTSTITPAATLTIADGVSHNWSAGALINNATPPLAPGTNPWLSQANSVNLTIENLLTAYTQLGTGPQQALIEKKFNGVEVMVTPVPLPAAVWLLGSVLATFGFGSRRRSRALVECH